MQQSTSNIQHPTPNDPQPTGNSDAEIEFSTFPETADIETSSDGYAARFKGPTGIWMLSVQESIASSLVANTPGATILDVGGGHGQLAVPLCRHGYDVTVTGSDPICRTRLAQALKEDQYRFELANILDLPHDDRSFDHVFCFRLVTHCEQWPTLIAELCRTARTSVIIDYPTSQSLNAIAPTLFAAKKRIEKNTREWRLFRHQELIAEFAKHGFRVARRQGQFFLPMVLHRALKCPSISRGLEAICRGLGLTRRYGSPVIIQMTRRPDC